MSHKSLTLSKASLTADFGSFCLSKALLLITVSSHYIQGVGKCDTKGNKETNHKEMIVHKKG